MVDEIVSAGRSLRKISGAEALEGRVVRVTWSTGAVETIDIAPALASHRAYVRLRADDALFQSLKVGEFGGSLEWADGSELAAAWIEELADALLTNAEFREAMDRMNMSLDGMAAHLGIARRLVAGYRKDKPIPKAVALATRYLLATRGAS
ncbi:MAG TPA: hypothetical protein PK286_09475 [Devosia sp.]|nr:hypothetical protein [Devosia sp.]